MLAAGIAGLALPIIPGWVLVIPALLILGREFRWARALLDRLKRLRNIDLRKYSSNHGEKNTNGNP